MAATMHKNMGIVLSDVHVPFQDKQVCGMALKFIRDQKPGIIHLLGDIADFYAVSRFDKDTSRKIDLQAELDDTVVFLQKVREAAPDSRILYSEGNHEFRLRRYLRSEARALALLRSLTLENLLSFEDLGIEYRTSDKPYRNGSLLYTHGQIVRKWSAYTAKGHFEKYGSCVIHGHTHRLGAFYHRDLDTTYGAWENGCLCDLNPEYAATPDWQHGWSVVWTKKDFFHVEQVAVIKGQYHYHGKTYGRRRLSATATQSVEDIGN